MGNLGYTVVHIVPVVGSTPQYIVVGAVVNTGFIGMGHMAKPIAATCSRLHKPVYVHDPAPEARAYCNKMDYVYCHDNVQLLASSDIIFVLVKPQMLIEVLRPLGALSAGKCFVSFAAGVKVDTIAHILHPTANVMRVMPNTPMQIKCGASALAIPGKSVPEKYVAFLREILQVSGDYVELPESQMNAVIAVNGSTPALFYQLAQCIADFGVKHGIDEQAALRLIAKTMEGSAKMLQGKLSPIQLTDAVTSKGGTTFAMLEELQKSGFFQVLSAGLDACVKRAEEM